MGRLSGSGYRWVNSKLAGSNVAAGRWITLLISPCDAMVQRLGERRNFLAAGTDGEKDGGIAPRQ